MSLHHAQELHQANQFQYNFCTALQVRLKDKEGSHNCPKFAKPLKMPKILKGLTHLGLDAAKIAVSTIYQDSVTNTKGICHRACVFKVNALCQNWHKAFYLVKYLKCRGFVQPLLMNRVTTSTLLAH